MTATSKQIEERHLHRNVAAAVAIVFSFSLTCGASATLADICGLSAFGTAGAMSIGTAVGCVVLYHLAAAIAKALPPLDEP